MKENSLIAFCGRFEGLDERVIEGRQMEEISIGDFVLAGGLEGGKVIPDFSAGDTLIVQVRITEGSRTRLQAFEGVCIARSGKGVNESFTVRKISYGEGVERVFPVFSPLVEAIEIKRKGKVRRAKLYYLRDRRGKSARIVERTTGRGIVAARKKGEARKKKDA